MVQYCSKKNSVSISRVLYHIGTLELLAPLKLLMVASIINLESRITTCFCCFLPSNSREQRSNVGILGIAAHSVVVSPAQRRLVSVPVTKHCCLTAINRCGALCCPDFPRDRGLKQVFFFPYPAIDRYTMSGIRESNPPPRLGKPMHYRCANAAKIAAKVRIFLQICKKNHLK